MGTSGWSISHTLSCSKTCKHFQGTKRGRGGQAIAIMEVHMCSQLITVEAEQTTEEPVIVQEISGVSVDPLTPINVAHLQRIIIT